MKKRMLLLAVGAMSFSLLTACQKKETPEIHTSTNTETIQDNQDGSEDMAKSEESTISMLRLPDYEFTRENLPRMDGSTSLAPLGKALVGALLGETEEKAEELVSFNKTTQSYRNLMYGECELVLGSWPNEAVFDEMKNTGFDCLMEEISTEALIFVVNENNPVDNLTTEQIRDIYSGKITNWSEVGGNDETIDAFQRNQGSGSQALMEKLVMQDLEMSKAPESYMIGDMGELMEAVKNYDNSATALGYSVYYYANDMKMAEGLKIISVDGVMPNADTIRQKKYPHTNAYYCAINGASEKDSAQRIIYDWLAGEEGQKLVASQGYVSILDTGIAGKETPLVTNRYTRKTEKFIDDLDSGSEYGMLYPFFGELIYSSDEDGYSYMAGKKCGLMDENGCIVVDPVYTDYSLLEYYDNGEHALPFWVLEKMVEGDNKEESERMFGLVSFDGKIVLECKYDAIYAGADGIIVREDYEKPEFTLLDFQGNVILSNKDVPIESPYFYIDMSDGEGILTVQDEDAYYFVDTTGKRLFDQSFSYASTFYRGRAVVSQNERCGIIDTKGNFILLMEYDWTNVTDENFLFASNGEMEYLFDKEGKLLSEVSGAYHLFTDSDGNYCMYTDEDVNTSVVFKSPDGKPAYSFVPQREEFVGEHALFYHVDGNTLTVINKKTGQEETFEGYDGIEPLFGSGMRGEGISGSKQDIQYYTLYSYGEDPMDEKTVLLNQYLEPLLEVNGSITYMQDIVNEKVYFVAYEVESRRHRLYSEDLKEICLSENWPIVCNDKIITYNNYCATCIDLDGNIVFCYGFTGSYDD